MADQCDKSSVLFAGGGTGGHLFPSLAAAERLREMRPDIGVHFACSNRPLDAQILTKAGVGFTPLTVRPLPRRPQHVPGFLWAYGQSKRMSRALIRERGVGVVVAMGGFVCAPVVAAARREHTPGVPAVLVNLDAVPGKANRHLMHKCDAVYSVYDSPVLPRTMQKIALPLRRSCLAGSDVASCRRELGIDPDRPALLITAGSQGAESINRMMIELAGDAAAAGALRGWTIVHLAGAEREADVKRAYDAAGIDSLVTAFSDRMGLCWGAAELAISRAGANSVAEVAANAVPTVFLPYPYHKDQHQKLNAQPLVDAGAAVMWDDLKDGAINAKQLGPKLIALLGDASARDTMRSNLRRTGGDDGAEQLARAVIDLLEG